MGENDLDYTFPNGDYYEGEWKNGKPHGQGTFIYNTKYNNQNKYVGGFKDGKHHGHGSYTYSYGIKYVGEFKDGKWHGHGSYNYANGNTYVGQWENGNPQGQGTVIYTNGNKYVGEFKDGMKSGYGVHIFAEGERYEGEFKDDKFSGQGTYTLILSEDAKKKYVGQWKDNKAHGQGTSYDAKGKVYQEGIFEDGKFLENKSVFVISVPRSGSFYVTKLLSQKYNISYAGEIFNNRKLVAYLKVDISSDRALLRSGSPSAGGFGSNPSSPSSNDRNAFCKDSRKVLPIDMTSPTLCIWTPKCPVAEGNFSKSKRGTLVTI